RMLAKGKPLPGCQVKIMMLERWGLLGGIKKGIRFETITDENGVYHFENVPTGGYKLYWKPPRESSWIRRLQMEPDIYVESGERYYLPDRETHIKLLN
ncbi:MAG: carboxypeptidase-like regulatory domain-containing protein, partial [Candidatus Scalindua sp.]